MNPGEPDLPEPCDAEEVARAAQRLRRSWLETDRSDPTHRSQTKVALDHLRGLYSRRPELFRSDSIAALRVVSRGLSQSPRIQGAVAGTPLDALRGIFGFDSFRPGQSEIIDAVLAGRDCLGIMPTGAGKSLTYQIPSRILGGTSLVVSPLISLMKDQVDGVREQGLRAVYLNSTLAPQERQRRIAAVQAGEVELVYAAPEGLEASVGAALARVDLSLIAVDEAHCISHWGHDFRPSYRKLTYLKRRFGAVPVLALTATATRKVVADISDQLAMEDPVLVRGSFFRPNLKLATYRKGGGTPPVGEAIARIVKSRPGQSGIVYTLSRKSAETTAAALARLGVRAAAYHAGLEAEERHRVQEAFQRDELDVIAATVAFGMGIDKSNVRFVIHRDMPRSIESYYQEIGRAGRDGQDSDCILFYSWGEVITYDRLQGDDSSPEIMERHRARVREMFRFAELGACRHRSLARYFEEKIPPCGSSCDICSGADPLADARSATRRKAPRQPAPMDSPLFDRLRALRKEIADQRGIPAYLIFTDATLAHMATERPESPAALLRVSGVGQTKLEQFGDQFLVAIREWEDP